MSEPKVVVAGLLAVIEKDLEKHKVLLERTKVELLAYREARSHEIKRKKVWKGHIGGGKYNDDSLRASMNDIAINIRHMSDKIKLSQEKIKFEQNIVETLTENARIQAIGEKQLAQYFRDHPEERPDANRS